MGTFYTVPTGIRSNQIGLKPKKSCLFLKEFIKQHKSSFTLSLPSLMECQYPLKEYYLRVGEGVPRGSSSVGLFEVDGPVEGALPAARGRQLVVRALTPPRLEHLRRVRVHPEVVVSSVTVKAELYPVTSRLYDCHYTEQPRVSRVDRLQLPTQLKITRETIGDKCG